MSKNIKVLIDYTEIPVTSFKFKGGEVHVKVELSDKLFNEVIEWPTDVVIKANLCSSDDIMELLLIKDALERCFLPYPKTVSSYMLEINYLAYARQDRVNVQGEAFSLAVMARLINSCNFDSVTLTDPHSDVASALINNCSITSLTDCYLWNEPEMAQYIKGEYVLVAPDAGAAKKVQQLARQLDCPVIQAFKQRDTRTGEITGTSLADVSHIDNLKDKNIIIADDICDAGRTFIELGKILKPLTEKGLYLYVTHGIFSHPEGKGVFKDIFDGVFCYNDMSK